MSARKTPAGESGTVTVSEEHVKMLAQALERAAAALRDAERLMVGFAPANAMKAEKMAEEYESVAKVLRVEKLNQDNSKA